MRTGAPTRARTLAALACSVAALLQGCASPRSPGASAPAPRSSEAAPPRTAAPAQGSYGPEPETALAPVEQRLLEVARARLGGAQSSGALSLAARELAARAAAGDPEARSGPASRAALARALSFDPSPSVYALRARPEDAADALARLLPGSTASHVGAGAVERDGVLHAFVLAAQRKVGLEPFRREVSAGTSAVLSGRLARGLRAARVFVTLPAGDVREVDTEARGSGFRARLSFPERGRYTVEVVGEGPRGPEVAAILTVAAGGATVEAPEGPARAAADPGDPAAAEAAIVRAINATRRRRGLPPVAASAELAAVARRHSAAMRDAATVAHVLPGSGEVGDRLRHAGVAYRFAYENVAQAPRALLAHAKIEESPAHLANLLAPATLVGVGLAHGTLRSGAPAVYVTEILVQPPDDGGESALLPDARVREALWRERARLGRPPLLGDPALDALAREAAETMRRADSPEAGDLGARALAGRALSAVDVFVASAPAETIRSRNLPDPRFHRVGVGVATGDSRRYGARRLWIAVIYTD
ncbi:MULTISPECIES: CAP domain-containing protein [unclassified Anaeromyxobacter]|uniref:CAP domain-containing protein n=1 Tax=unclassified Anaeromyxobacter TaxID=2620896 RepID=UPI001F567868|nr:MULTISPECIES: CAP domain-containing protein [unclassified Anaeromyxobacter]